MNGAVLREGVAGLFPGYFSLVMATGIVSIAALRLGFEGPAVALLAINVVAYAVLSGLTIARLIAFPRRVIDDLTSHSRGPGFFTLVAGTCVLGNQLLLITGSVRVAAALLALGALLWLVVMYAFLTAVIIREEKPTLEAGINGAWLIATVATQSVSVLGALLSRHAGPGQTALLFVCLCLFLLGCMLYLSIITLIFYRFTFLRLPAELLTPPYWINMGAVAITTLAGSTLLLQADAWPFLASLVPFLRGFTLFFWATASWWIPLLIILGIWRHGIRRYPLTYDPQYWGMVFPLGMYAASTYQLARATGIDLLDPIPRLFLWIAFAAWAVTFAGLAKRLAGEGRRMLQS